MTKLWISAGEVAVAIVVAEALSALLLLGAIPAILTSPPPRPSAAPTPTRFKGLADCRSLSAEELTKAVRQMKDHAAAAFDGLAARRLDRARACGPHSARRPARLTRPPSKSPDFLSGVCEADADRVFSDASFSRLRDARLAAAQNVLRDETAQCAGSACVALAGDQDLQARAGVLKQWRVSQGIELAAMRHKISVFCPQARTKREGGLVKLTLHNIAELCPRDQAKVLKAADMTIEDAQRLAADVDAARRAFAACAPETRRTCASRARTHSHRPRRKAIASSRPRAATRRTDAAVNSCR